MHQLSAKLVWRNLLAAVLFTLAGMVSAEPGSLLIVRDNQNHPPYEMQTDGRLSGFHIELLQSVAQQMGIQIRFESVPWARAVEMLEHGKADAITYFTRTKEREKFAIYHSGNIISFSGHYLLHHKDHPLDKPFQGDLKQLSGKMIGIEHGFSYGDAFDNADFIKKMAVKNNKHMLALLKNNRIDLALVEDEDFYMMQNNPEFSDLRPLPVAFGQEPNYLAFSRKRGHQRFARRFAKAMQTFKQSLQYQQLAQHYQQPAPSQQQVCAKAMLNDSQC